MRYARMSLTVVAVTLLLPSPAVAAGATATVQSGGTGLNMRAGGSTADRQVGRLADGARLTVVCQVYGEFVVGTQRRTPNWNRLSNGHYVSDAYVRWSPQRPWVHWCGPKGAALPTVRTGSGPVNVRNGANTRAARVATLPEGNVMVVECQVWGELVSGRMRRSAAWNRLPGGRYVADANVEWRTSQPTLPWCGQSAPTVPPANTAQFIARVAEPARAGFRQYKVPASVTIAQAIQESGWGKSWLTRRDHSYFGIKCFGSPGGIAVGCRSYATTECDSKGKCWSTTASFRTYRNATGSFADHGHFLNVNPRYKNAFAYSNNPDRFAQEIHKAGYATSPTYAQNLIALMKQYNLYRYDK
ncbi:sporangiospore maturation cell wall hydrolase GsmA [Phytohabitans kaempferiae]|uniref:Sporangiospore maturation cell wall hydrolase GsmA n=1 Tax=Phytohabitans kaempferiae TaxID=1620943 RepID=A0ABV6M146_9ACTN